MTSSPLARWHYPLPVNGAARPRPRARAAGSGAHLGRVTARVER